MTIKKATTQHLTQVVQLYDDVNDHLAKGENYPGWKKGLYPTAETALWAERAQTLYIMEDGPQVVGSMVLNHQPEPAYANAQWGIDVPYSEILVVRTLAVHPAHRGRGVGGQLLGFAQQKALAEHLKALRLDVYEGNAPAIALYEKSGYTLVGTADMGIPGLPWFRLYEKIL